MKVAIIGGGAAGFFSAIAVKENYPKAHVIIYEKTEKLLSKVKVSGGGRCNVTNGCRNISQLSKAYPRGSKQLKKAFNIFNTSHTFDWFESRGVPLKVEADGRAFPKTNSSQSIVDCLTTQTKKNNIQINTGYSVKDIKANNNGLELSFTNDKSQKMIFDKVIIACGGFPKRKGFDWLEKLGHTIIDPVPSLFTFNMPNNPIVELMGLVAEHTLTSIQGTKLNSNGPLLITHWGMSGPAILKLSSFGARELNERSYDFNVQISWVNEKKHELIFEQIEQIIEKNPKKVISNIKAFGLPERLWLFILKKANISSSKRLEELGKKAINKLTSTLCNDTYHVKGKTTFKEEFVTCGGISLDDIDFNTMQSKVCDNLYFAGEILDIDAITGGYNFQAAWTTAFIAGKLQ